MSLTVNQVKSVLNHAIQNNRYLEKCGKKKNAYLIESMPGIGKTSLVQQVAEDLGLKFIKVSLSNIEQAGDICGFPIREFQRVDGSWENEKTIQYSSSKFPLNGNARTSYCPPSWVPDSNNGGAILCLDDFTRAPMHIMQAVMEIIDRQEYISWKLPKDCHIFMTSNPVDTGDFHVTSLDSAQQTRYIKLKMEFNINEWATWAEYVGVDSRCINFLLFNPEMISGHVNARLATDYFNSISSISDFSATDSLNLIQLIGEGSVGEEFSVNFALFINNQLDKLPSPADIFSSIDSCVDKILLCTGSPDSSTYKQSVSSVISTRIINHCKKLSVDKKIDKKKHPQILIKLINSNVFNGDIAYNLIKTINQLTGFDAVLEDKNVLKIATR